MQFAAARAIRLSDRHHPRERKSLDGVVPTAVEALGRKREALCVLRDIDALLLHSEEDDDTKSSMTPTTKTIQNRSVLSQGKENASNSGTLGDGGSRSDIKDAPESTTPGPGIYTPNMRVVDKQTHFMATFRMYSGRSRCALPWKLVKRNAKTPGPGSYTISRADNVAKPRVVSASFQSTSTRYMKTQHGYQQDQELNPAKMAKTSSISSLTETKSCGLVGYKPPTKPSYRTREQKQRIRSVLAARKRWRHLGFYDVNHACVERRLGVTMIVPMAKQSSDSKSQSKQLHPVQLRRKLRLWRSLKANLPTPVNSNKVTPGTATAKKSQAWKTEKEKASYKTTEQWRRAQTRQLLRVKELKARAILSTGNHGNDVVAVPTMETSSLLMPADAMNKHLGRDTIACRQKKLKIVSSFSAEIQKEPTKATGQAQSDALPAPPKRIGGGIVPFAKMTGRNDVQTDKHGVYILGKETEQLPEANESNLDQVDKIFRPRAPTALILTPDIDEERFLMMTKITKEHEVLSVLEPKFGAVKKSVSGHRFVHFEKQLDRPDFVPSRDDNRAEQALVLPSEFSILERLKFPGTNQKTVDYTKMQGRNNVERLGGPRQHTLDVVCEPVRDHNLPRALAPTPVNVSKMLSISTTVPGLNDGVLKDHVLYKLRENHDEIEKAMQLLSKFKRSDVGSVDMCKATARFTSMKGDRDNNHGEAYEQIRPSHLELSVLSSKVRVDQVLVDMSKSQERWRLRGNEKDHHHPEPVLVLNVKDDLLSKRKRSVGLVDMKNQILRRDAIVARARFLDLTRDSVTTRFLQRQMEH